MKSLPIWMTSRCVLQEILNIIVMFFLLFINEMHTLNFFLNLNFSTLYFPNHISSNSKSEHRDRNYDLSYTNACMGTLSSFLDPFEDGDLEGAPS